MSSSNLIFTMNKRMITREMENNHAHFVNHPINFRLSYIPIYRQRNEISEIGKTHMY